MSFNVRKAAQVVAFLANERGGQINFITVVKLAYLSDRRFMEMYDHPILDDRFVSMEYGPVNSATYDLLKGQGEQRDTWESYLKTDEAKNSVALTRKLSEDDFDELSDAEIKVLRAVSKEFEKFKNPFDLVEWIHKNCEEWEDVGKTSKLLSYERVFNALGKKNITACADNAFEFQNIKDALTKAK
jgi:uncharacterized phage-associated protein